MQLPRAHPSHCPVTTSIWTKISRPSTQTPLNCSDHPFFEDIPKIPEEHKALYDHDFAKEGDIFEGFMLTRLLSRNSFLRRFIRAWKILKSSTSWMSPIMLFEGGDHGCENVYQCRVDPEGPRRDWRKKRPFCLASRHSIAKDLTRVAP